MRIIKIAFALVLSALSSVTSFGAVLTLERIFAAPDLAGSLLRNPVFSPDGRLVTYLQGKANSKDRLDIWAYEVSTARRSILVDSSSLVTEEGQISNEEESRRERQRTSSLSGILEYEFSSDSRYLLVPLAGDLFLYDLKAQPGNSRTHRLTQTDAAETDAHFSPKGKYISFVREQNLYAIELSSGREITLTQKGGGLVSYGVAEFIAQEEMDRFSGYWWAPDESKIAYTRVDESTVDELERIEIYADTVKIINQRYPAAGRPNARVNLYFQSLSDPTSEHEIKAAASGSGYIARVNWFPDSQAIAVQHQSRDQKTLALLKIDIISGLAKTLLEENSSTWIDLNDELTFLKKSAQFLWASSRSGYLHLYLYDLEGRLIRQVTSGTWVIAGDNRSKALKGIDEKNDLVYFSATRETPLERHLYVASLTRNNISAKRLSTSSGWHSITMASNTSLWLDVFSTPEQPPSLILHHIAGKSPKTLVANTLTTEHPYAPYLDSHQATEFGILQAVDGQILHYKIIKPRNMIVGKRYPVMVDVYGGPGSQRVRRAWDGYFNQYMAQHGYVIFTLDNRGTPFRGKEFENSIYHQLSKVEVEDQLRGVEYLRTLAFVDADRIGIFGWSYGGYMALMCMLRAPSYFKAGVAGAPVTDWKLYDTHYTERFMGTPTENPEGYKESSVMTHAAELTGPLLVLHGMADDNVLFSNSTMLFKQLQDLRKPFNAMPYPGGKHGLMRFSDTGEHGYATVKKFFDQAFK